MDAQLNAVKSEPLKPLPIQQIKRSTLAIVVTLALLLIGPSLYQVVALSDNLGGYSSERADAIDTTRAWFSAVNHYLRSGSADDIDSLLSPEFVDHNPLPGLDSGGTGYLLALDALRVRFPDIQLQASIAGVAGDVVIADVRAMAGDYPVQLDEPTSDDTGHWTYTERLRIADDKVLERWSDDVPFPLMRVETTLASTSPLMSVGRVSRLTSTAGRLFAPRQMLVLVESGEARFLSVHGVSVVANGDHVQGIPNLTKEVVAKPGDLVYAEKSFVIEIDDTAAFLVFDDGQIPTDNTKLFYANQKATAEATTPMESLGNRNSEFSLYEISSADAVITMTPLADMPAESMFQFEREVVAVPFGELLPTGPQGELAILRVVNGEVLHGVDGSRIHAGESLILTPDKTTGMLVVTEAASVELITVSLEQAA